MHLNLLHRLLRPGASTVLPFDDSLLISHRGGTFGADRMTGMRDQPDEGLTATS